MTPFPNAPQPSPESSCTSSTPRVLPLRDASPSAFEPCWEGVFERFTRAFVARNLWKLTRTCTFDDAMQEAQIVWLDCVRRYADKVDNAAWFMSLYRRSLETRIMDLATVDTRHRQYVLLNDLGDDEDAAPVPEAVGELENEGYLRLLVAQAPSEIRAVLVLLLNAPTEIATLVTDAWSGRGKSRSTGSKVLCRMLGIPERATLLEEVREYLEPAKS